MDTQQIDHTITRARRNTIGDAVRRSAARNPRKDAIIFGERRWSYAELDAGTNRVANALLAQGLEKGDRVAAYGMNSDAGSGGFAPGPLRRGPAAGRRGDAVRRRVDHLGRRGGLQTQ